MEEESKICPLCDGPVDYYYINFTELLLMCGCIYCDFPFGYEDLQIITKEEWINQHTGSPTRDYDSTLKTKLYSMANSQLSLERSKINKLINKLENKSKKDHKNKEKNLARIKKLNEKLNLLKNKQNIIRNDEFIRQATLKAGRN